MSNEVVCNGDVASTEKGYSCSIIYDSVMGDGIMLEKGFDRRLHACPNRIVAV
jgi:hypothetical protein